MTNKEQLGSNVSLADALAAWKAASCQYSVSFDIWLDMPTKFKFKVGDVVVRKSDRKAPAATIIAIDCYDYKLVWKENGIEKHGQMHITDEWDMKKIAA